MSTSQVPLSKSRSVVKEAITRLYDEIFELLQEIERLDDQGRYVGNLLRTLDEKRLALAGLERIA